MKLLISTPCSGGMLYSKYVGSLMETMSTVLAEGLLEGWQIHFQDKESLIHRARNRAATMCLEGGFDKLLTIDADISWTVADFKRVVFSDKPIVGGTYPLKSFPIVMNFNPLLDQGSELFSTFRGIDLDAFSKFKEKYTDSDGIAKVRHLPTGFLCVSSEVLAKLSHTVEVYESFDSAKGERKKFFNFYPSDVKEGMLRSEDWSFCDLAREAGFDIHFDTKVIVTHTGNHDYRLGQFFGAQ